MPDEIWSIARAIRPQWSSSNAVHPPHPARTTPTPRPLRSTHPPLRPARSTRPPRRRMRRCPAGNLYSPGGCGCALLMAPVMVLGVGITLALMGLALVALVGLVVAIVLTVREVRRARADVPVRTGMAVLIGALYLLCIPYLAFFAWFWFID